MFTSMMLSIAAQAAAVVAVNPAEPTMSVKAPISDVAITTIRVPAGTSISEVWNADPIGVQASVVNPTTLAIRGDVVPAGSGLLVRLKDGRSVAVDLRGTDDKAARVIDTLAGQYSAVRRMVVEARTPRFVTSARDAAAYPCGSARVEQAEGGIVMTSEGRSGDGVVVYEPSGTVTVLAAR